MNWISFHFSSGPSINYVRFLGGGGVSENLTFSDKGGRGGYLISDVRKYVVIFYAEILTKKVVLECFFTSKSSEIIHNSIF